MTNHLVIRGQALLRCDDGVLEFEPPKGDQVRKLIVANPRPMTVTNPDRDAILKAAQGRCQSEIVRLSGEKR